MLRGPRGRVLSACMLTAGALLLTACGGGVPEGAIEAQGEACPTGSDCYDPVRPIGPGGSLDVEAFEWGFDIVEGVARDGTVEVTLENTGGTDHNITIDAAVGETQTIPAAAGETTTGELQLFGGQTYTYYCSIPGHREQGMEGELRVLLPDEEPTDIGADSGEEATAEPAAEPAGGDGG